MTSAFTSESTDLHPCFPIAIFPISTTLRSKATQSSKNQVPPSPIRISYIFAHSSRHVSEQNHNPDPIPTQSMSLGGLIVHLLLPLWNAYAKQRIQTSFLNF